MAIGPNEANESSAVTKDEEESILALTWSRFYENTTAHGIPHVMKAQGNKFI